MVEKSRRDRNVDDPPEELTFSSPPCFMHEVRPEYLGYMSEAEVEELLTEIRALWREALANVGDQAEAARHALRERCRQALPRVYPSTLRDELEEFLVRLDEEGPRGESTREE